MDTMVKTFYDQAKVLDLCKSDRNPSQERISLLISLIREDKYARYFFDGLENPAWIVPLYKDGFFYHIPDFLVGLLENTWHAMQTSMKIS
jgi:hypothetical protein